MAIYRENIIKIDLAGNSIARNFVGNIVGEGDKNADRFGVEIYRNGEPVSVSGLPIYGYFIRADKSTVLITNGTAISNIAYVTLPQACYVYEGAFTLAIKVMNSDEVGTVRIVDGTVAQTTTDTQVDPGHVIPTIEELIALIEETEAAAEAAKSASNNVMVCVEKLFYFEEKPASPYTSDGYKLLDSGLCTPDSNYQLLKYGSTIAGQKLRIKTPHKAQFQNGANVPSSGSPDRIGPTYSNIDQIIETPSGADWLILSVPKNTTNHGVYFTYDKMPTNVNSLEIGNFEHGSMTNGMDDTYNEGSRIRTDFLYAMRDIEIHPVSGADGFVYFFDNAGKFLRSTGWIDGNYTIEKGSRFRACLCYSRSDNTQRTIEEILARFKIISPKYNVNEIGLTDTYPERLIERGSLSGANPDDEFRRGVRGRSKDVCHSQYNVVINRNYGAFQVLWYDAEMNYTGSYTNWTTKTFMIPAGKYWKLLIDEDPSAPNDGWVSMAQITGAIEIDVKKTYQYSQNPNIIWQCRDVDDTRFPPHSKAAIRAAAENEYDRVKICCRVTTDGQFIAVHDNYINGLARNPDGTQISTQIATDNCTLAQLNSYDWGIQYGAEYAGMGVPLVADALKYAAMYNLGVTMEFYYYPTNAQIDALFGLMTQYGLVENLIIVTSNLLHFQSMQYWKSKNKKISYYVGGTYETISGNIENINALKSGENTVYAEPLPWQTVADENFRALAMANSWRLYSSGAMSESEMFNVVGVNHGYTLISVGNVYMIKDTMRRWANKQS